MYWEYNALSGIVLINVNKKESYLFCAHKWNTYIQRRGYNKILLDIAKTKIIEIAYEINMNVISAGIDKYYIMTHI